ncbi:MAG: hypothetical protein ACK53Q_11110 [Dolichospermum sp.]
MSREIMLNQQRINQLIDEQNADAINSIYWELPSKTQRLIDKMIAKYWRFDAGTLSDF